MIGERINLFRLSGIQIRLDWSWFLIAALVTWTLATAVFPGMAPGLGAGAYWVMGSLGAVGLFASILAHELAHARFARRHGIPLHGITLFLFGGVAELAGEPETARTELGMAAAGPVTSVVVAILAGAAAWAGRGVLPPAVTAVVTYLAMINVVVAAFNLIPAFPLDRGRILRAVLWRWKGDLRWATKVAARAGSGFSVFLMAAGVARLLWGDGLGGLWWILIGVFLRRAAGASYQQVLLRHALEGEPVRHFMSTNVVTVPPDTTVAELVERYIYGRHHTLFPVTSNGTLLGYVSTAEVRAVPRSEWGEAPRGCHRRPRRRGEREPGHRCHERPRADAPHRPPAPPRGGRRPPGRGLTLKDLLKLFALKVELEA